MNKLTSVKDLEHAIEKEENKLVVIRFGDSTHPLCVHFDNLLTKITHKLQNFVKIYFCEKTDVQEIINTLDINDPLNVMCFYKCNHIKIDCSTGNNNKINFYIESKEELIDLFTLAYIAGAKNKRITVSPVDYSKTKKF